MLNYSGLNLKSETESESGKAAKETIGLNAFQEVLDKAIVAVGDERIDLFAQCEAMLLTGGIIRPYATSGATLRVSKIVPFTQAYGLYGQASWNAIPYLKYMKLQSEPVTTEQYEAAQAAWLAGE